MAVGLRIKFDGGTQEQYDALHSHMRVDENPPEGLIFHSAGPIEGGWGVIDFWESRDAFDRFAQSRLQQSLQELGDQTMQGPPDIKEFTVHNITKP
jgi:quinol monooxygenase YgiN